MVLPLLFGVTAVGGGLAWILDKGGLLDADAVVFIDHGSYSPASALS